MTRRAARRHGGATTVDLGAGWGRGATAEGAEPQPERQHAAEPRYATKMDFDKRFEYLRPASFPMTRRYEVDSWDQDWQEVEGAGVTPAGLALAE